MDYVMYIYVCVVWVLMIVYMYMNWLSNHKEFLMDHLYLKDLG